MLTVSSVKKKKMRCIDPTKGKFSFAEVFKDVDVDSHIGPAGDAALVDVAG